MTTAVPLATALLLGMQHALEVDHLVAVTTFVARRPGLGSAARFGARWGFGHAVAVCAFGGLLLATGLRLPEHLVATGEAVVGVMLVGLGAWTLRSVRRIHEHGAMVHAHAPHEPHGPRPMGAGAAWVGLTHGLAGTSGAVALVPVTLLASRPAGVSYLVAFGAGTMLAMTAAAVVAALAVRRAAHGSVAWARLVTGVTGAAAIGVGLLWLSRALPAIRPN